jgi:hypothetical protein
MGFCCLKSQTTGNQTQETINRCNYSTLPHNQIDKKNSEINYQISHYMKLKLICVETLGSKRQKKPQFEPRSQLPVLRERNICLYQTYGEVKKNGARITNLSISFYNGGEYVTFRGGKRFGSEGLARSQMHISPSSAPEASKLGAIVLNSKPRTYVCKVQREVESTKLRQAK